MSSTQKNQSLISYLKKSAFNEGQYTWSQVGSVLIFEYNIEKYGLSHSTLGSLASFDLVRYGLYSAILINYLSGRMER